MTICATLLRTNAKKSKKGIILTSKELGLSVVDERVKAQKYVTTGSIVYQAQILRVLTIVYTLVVTCANVETFVSTDSDCSAETYQDNQGQSVCKTCPAGYRCDRNQINLENCEPGEFCPESTEVPTKCQIGTFNEAQNSFDETFCVTCLPGTYCDQEGMSEGEICPKSYHCSANLTWTDQRPNEGKCTAGHYCEVGSEMEQPCEAGYYIPFELAEECVLCPAGYYCPVKPS